MFSLYFCLNLVWLNLWVVCWFRVLGVCLYNCCLMLGFYCGSLWVLVTWGLLCLLDFYFLWCFYYCLLVLFMIRCVLFICSLLVFTLCVAFGLLCLELFAMGEFIYFCFNVGCVCDLLILIARLLLIFWLVWWVVFLIGLSLPIVGSGFWVLWIWLLNWFGFSVYVGFIVWIWMFDFIASNWFFGLRGCGLVCYEVCLFVCFVLLYWFKFVVWISFGLFCLGV